MWWFSLRYLQLSRLIMDFFSGRPFFYEALPWSVDLYGTPPCFGWRALLSAVSFFEKFSPCCVSGFLAHLFFKRRF